jgi:hypothetical protein
MSAVEECVRELRARMGGFRADNAPAAAEAVHAVDELRVGLLDLLIAAAADPGRRASLVQGLLGEMFAGSRLDARCSREVFETAFGPYRSFAAWLVLLSGHRDAYDRLVRTARRARELERPVTDEINTLRRDVRTAVARPSSHQWVFATLFNEAARCDRDRAALGFLKLHRRTVVRARSLLEPARTH